MLVVGRQASHTFRIPSPLTGARLSTFVPRPLQACSGGLFLPKHLIGMPSIRMGRATLVKLLWFCFEPRVEAWAGARPA